MQPTGTLVPSHAEPGVQVSHAARVVVSAPNDVKLPRGQVKHAAAPAMVEYKLSFPHLLHVVLPAPLYWPGAHLVDVSLVPSQVLPAGHSEHVWRVPVVPPLVNFPAKQRSHVADRPRDRSPAHANHRGTDPRADHHGPAPGTATHGQW